MSTPTNIPGIPGRDEATGWEGLERLPWQNEGKRIYAYIMPNIGIPVGEIAVAETEDIAYCIVTVHNLQICGFR